MYKQKPCLRLWGSHLCEALQTPPGQLSSEPEQRKQQIREPVRKYFQISINPIILFILECSALK